MRHDFLLSYVISVLVTVLIGVWVLHDALPLLRIIVDGIGKWMAHGGLHKDAVFTIGSGFIIMGSLLWFFGRRYARYSRALKNCRNMPEIWAHDWAGYVLGGERCRRCGITKREFAEDKKL